MRTGTCVSTPHGASGCPTTENRRRRGWRRSAVWLKRKHDAKNWNANWPKCRRSWIASRRRPEERYGRRAVDEHQRYFFDLNGYLVIENALTPEEVAAC